jgi:hypothetical protein
VPNKILQIKILPNRRREGEWEFWRVGFFELMSLSGVSSEKTVRVGLKVRDWSVADGFQTF